MRQRWMFDDAGEVWPSVEEELTRRLATHMCPRQLCDYAVTNLGFISLEDVGQSIHIRLRKSKVSPVALTSLLYCLADRSFGRAVLSVLDADWTHEIFGNARTLYARLNRLAVEMFEDEGDRFFQETVELDDLEPFEPHAILYRYWKSHRLDMQNAVQLSCDLFDGRFTIVSVQPSSDMVIEHVGGGYTTYSNSYVERAPGTRYEDEPDSVYGQWVASTHRDVHQSGEPLLEDVDALIGASRGDRRRVRYRRIVLPFTSAVGDPFLVTASTVRPDIDIHQGTL